jgi:hypothetical protein
MGKTYVALAVATRYQRTALVAPAVLLSQWKRTSTNLSVALQAVSHESLSRQKQVPDVDLIIVDEAHRFRNPETRRYDCLARNVRHAHLLLLTATPVVNAPADIVNLVRLFLADNALSAFGLSSLETAKDGRNNRSIATGTAPLLVARSNWAARSCRWSVPVAHDAPVILASSVGDGQLDTVVTMMESLQFPSFGDRRACELLLLHLYHRLASSAPACAETLSRHRAYLDRAISTAQRGERLTREAFGTLFRPEDDLQLELEVLTATTGAQPLDITALHRERDRICEILRRLRLESMMNPKAERLKGILMGRRGQKTIVFVSAISTALELAQRLGWRSLAVATGRGARIASGRVSVSDVLGLFAPTARNALVPPRCAQVEILIATDLVSEGLDLQDADGVVHYDLPWTPLRLQQRLGRIARLGSPHRNVRVWWFCPPPVLERRLCLRSRIAVKVAHQRELGVTVTSRVGRARVLGQALEWRERIAEASASDRPRPPCYAVVTAPPLAAYALRWDWNGSAIPEVVVVAGSPPHVVDDLERVCQILERLLRASSSERSDPAIGLSTLLTAVRERLASLAHGCLNEASQRLSRGVMQHAIRAAHARKPGCVDLLDAVLERINCGMCAGGERSLAAAIGREPGTASLERALRRWLEQWPKPAGHFPTVSLMGALLGDGTEDWPEAPAHGGNVQSRSKRGCAG